MMNAGANFRSKAFISSVFEKYYGGDFNLIIRHLILIGFEFFKLGSFYTARITEDLRNAVRDEATIAESVRDQLLIMKFIHNRQLIKLNCQSKLSLLF